MEYDKSNTAVFNLDNKSVLSGYIMAPTSKFSAEGGSKTFDYTSELKIPIPIWLLSAVLFLRTSALAQHVLLLMLILMR